VRAVRVALSGSSGLIGGALARLLVEDGATVVRLVRSQAGVGEILWDPVAGKADAAGLDGVDAIIHLAGENIASRRWNPEQKEKIRKSRVDGTRLLAETAAGLENKPKVFICASAVGYYGNRSETVDESSPSATGFLADLCSQWEAAAQAASDAGIRVVYARIGVVLSPKGGALKKMLIPFKMGVGGPLGDGSQPMPWIALDDVLGALRFLLERGELSGPFNLTSPNCVTNGEFTKALGRAVRRPAVLPMPAFAVKMLFGEMGEALLLGGAKVYPRRLEEAGFHFRFPKVEDALNHVLSSV